MRCPSCIAEVAPGKFCSECAAPLGDVDATETIAAPRQPSSSQTTSDEGRFPSGAVLGERYRILGLLGLGGMGEVYRAFDLKLDQVVALKFLPVATANNPRLLERFRGEVRIARQVSHRNVCRVHDIGEADGSAFLSMEYIDGDNLGNLLKQIGRLPGDKALEIARKLCAGLAAAHEKGVLHRDLKPANVMINRQGQVLIMDFGLAAAADAIAGGDIRSGTPAYMAPEQKEGREVTVRSDIYSLGLVFSEMFTGQKASHDAKLSTIVRDLDPVVEKVIQRCLDPNPSKRPASAIDVARMLPGGDPLAEALAAGDTPSPEMVAASDDTGKLSVRAATACFAIAVLSLAGQIFWTSRNAVTNLTAMPFPPLVLEEKAREILEKLGYADQPLDKAHAFNIDPGIQQWGRDLPAEQFKSIVAAGQPSLIRFDYWRSPRYLVTRDPSNVLTDHDPARSEGDINLSVDPRGRLIYLEAFPEKTQNAFPGTPWDKIFETAGLDVAQWTPSTPEELPNVMTDQRAAWTGTLGPGINARIEAAAWKGRPVFFQVIGPWKPQRDPTQFAGGPAGFVILAIVILGLVWAVANWRRGRGDGLGAIQLSLATITVAFLSNLLQGHLAPSSSAPTQILNALLAAGGSALFAGILYLALEPYIRRHWPQPLIAWSRVLSGNIRDPLVAEHILIGAAGGLALGLIQAALAFASGVPRIEPLSRLDLAGAVSGWANSAATAAPTALGMFFLFAVVRLLVRRTWLAALLSLVVILAPTFNGGARSWTLLVALISLATYLGIGIRFGMLAIMCSLVADLVRTYPHTSNLSAWYATGAWLTAALTLAILTWAYRTALGGRKLLRGDFLDR